MKQPLISVIIPTYNDALYIKQAINSVLQQDFQDFEIIVIDDGSTDNTKDVVLSLASKCPDKIEYLYQENKGPAAARNLGLSIARGKYICFLDADDYLMPKSLYFRYFYSQKNNLDFLSSNWMDNINGHLISSFAKNNYILTIKQCCRHQDCDPLYIVDKIDFIKLSLNIFCVHTNTVFLKTSIVKKENLLFCEELLTAEDMDMWWQYITSPSVNRIGILDIPLSVYNRPSLSCANHPDRQFHIYVHYCRLYSRLYSLYRDVLGKNFLADQIYKTKWMFKDPGFRLQFYKFLFKLAPLNVAFIKNFLGDLLRFIFLR